MLIALTMNSSNRRLQSRSKIIISLGMAFLFHQACYPRTKLINTFFYFKYQQFPSHLKIFKFPLIFPTEYKPNLVNTELPTCLYSFVLSSLKSHSKMR